LALAFFILYSQSVHAFFTVSVGKSVKVESLIQSEFFGDWKSVLCRGGSPGRRRRALCSLQIALIRVDSMIPSTKPIAQNLVFATLQGVSPMDAFFEDRVGDLRRSRWNGDSKPLLRVDLGQPSKNLLGQMVLSGEPEGERERISPLRGEVDPLRELPGWANDFQMAMDTLNKAGTEFNLSDVRDSDDASCANILATGLTSAGTRESLVASGKNWIASHFSGVSKALTIVHGGKAFMDALDTGSIDTVNRLASGELIEGQEAFFRESTLTIKGKCLIAIVKLSMVFGWLACAVGVGKALFDFVGVEAIPSVLSGLAVSTALTVATKVIVPQGKPSRRLCLGVFLLAVVGAISITVGAGLMKPRSEFEITEPSALPVDALLLGGVCLLDLALMLGLTCIARSVFHAASAFAQIRG